MSSRPLFVLAVLCILGSASASPAAAGCYWGGCQIGPCVYDNILLDHDFDTPSCSAWVFTGYTSRIWDADTCSSGFYDYQAVFYGSPSSGVVGVVYQDVEVPSTQSSAEVGFYVDIQGSAPSWWDRLKVTLRDPATHQVLETVLTLTGTSAVDCQFVSAQVQGNYAGQTIRLHFESTIWSGSETRFVIDGVAYWHFY